jgi:membrane protease YdiL (CAAX protease family)
MVLTVAEGAPPRPLPAGAPERPSAQPGGWPTFALYLLGGFGVFVVASLILALFVERLTIWTSLAAYLVNFVSFAGAAYVLGVRRPGLTWREFGLRPFQLSYLWLALLVAVFFTPLRAAAALLAEVLTGSGFETLQRRLDLVVPAGPLGLTFAVTLLGAGLLVPLAEELYFRGLLHRWLRSRFSFWPRVLLSSALFGLGHFDSPGIVASTFFLGLLCAITLERGRSLWLPVAIHAVNNSLAVMLLYLVQVAQR